MNNFDLINELDNIFKDMDEDFNPPKFQIGVQQKSDLKSIQMRNFGNQQYNMKKYNNALTFYNLSLLFAKSDEALALCYANRSAVYYVLKMYDQCVKNIDWTRESRYPKSKMQKLNERKEKCKKLMKKSISNRPIYPNKKIMDFFKLSYPASKTLPFLVDCIEMDKSTRKIIATQNLKAGDVICLEDPAVHFLRNSALLIRCSNCYEICVKNLIPCNKTASMMFCSTDCMKTFHSKALNINNILCDDVKLLSEMASAFGGLDKFKSYMADTTEFNHTIFDFDLSDPKDPDYNKNRMKCVLAMAKEYSYSTDEKTYKIQKYVSKEISDKLLKILMPNLPKHPFTCPLNPTDEAVIPLFAGILNHSCLPNVFTQSIGSKLATIALRPIKQGEEILISHFNDFGYALRGHSNSAAENMDFKCECQVCLDEKYMFYQPTKYVSRHEMSIDDAMLCIKEAWGYINMDPENIHEVAYYSKKIIKSLREIAVRYDYVYGDESDRFVLF